MPFLISADIKRFSYGPNSQPILDQFRLTIQAGEFVTVMGPSGVGKSTLLRILSGLERDLDGEVLIDKEPISKPRRDVQLLFQDTRLLPWKTAQQNVAFGSPASNSNSAATLRASYELLEKLGMAHRANAWPKNLSGGEKTRVGLGRALIASPDVLILDEPTRGLDIVSRMIISRLVRDPAAPNQMTTLMVNHDVEDAVLLSDRIVFVSGSPMKVHKELEVNLTYPREFDNPETLKLIGEARKIAQSALQ